MASDALAEKDPAMLQALYELAKAGTGDQLKAELKRQDVTCPVDDIRLLGEIDKVLPGDMSGNNKGKTLLHIACCHGNASTAKALLELGASPSERTPSVVETIRTGCGGHKRIKRYHAEETCMHLAASVNSGDVINVLRSNCRSEVCRDLANSQCADKRTPLEVLILRGSPVYTRVKGEQPLPFVCTCTY